MNRTTQIDDADVVLSFRELYRNDDDILAKRTEIISPRYSRDIRDFWTAGIVISIFFRISNRHSIRAASTSLNFRGTIFSISTNSPILRWSL